MFHRRVTLKFMVLTGMRMAELHGLRWSDFDFEKRLVRIRRNRLSADGFGVYGKDPKSKTSKRDIPPPAELIDDLKKYMDWFRLADDEFDSKLDEYYFSVNLLREPEGISSTAQWLAKFEKKHGLKKGFATRSKAYVFIYKTPTLLWRIGVFGAGERTCFSRASRKTVHRTIFLPLASTPHAAGS